MQVKIFKSNPKAVLPQYQSMGAAGFDFHCLEGFELNPGDIRIINTGLRMEVPWGYEVQVRPRSGLSFKTKIRVSNSPGTIDSDYRGDIGIILENIGEDTYVFESLDRIAQGVVSPIIQAEFIEVNEEDLTQTTRGNGGFGSTGAK